MTKQKWFEYGKVFGMQCLFEEPGDRLPMHKHAEDTEHNILLLRGAIRLLADGCALDFVAPTIINELPNPHEILALEPVTETLHLYRQGKPAGYDDLPESARSLSIDYKSK